MARSRLEKVGTLFSRVNGLLRSGALKEEDKPIWYELYKRFPPIEEPRFDRPAKDVPIREILYPEDVVRAKFHKLYGRHLRENLSNHQSETKCQQFINTYNSLMKQGNFHEEEIFDKAVEMLGLRNMRGMDKIVETNKNADENFVGGVQKDTIVSNFRKAREKRDEGSETLTDINIKDIFKE